MTKPEIAPIAAFDIFEDGRAVPANNTRTTPAKGALWRWFHLDLADPGLAEWAAKHLDDSAAASLMQPETRPRADTLGKGLVVTLRGVNLNPGQVSEDMVSLRLWATRNLIVSTRKRKVFVIDALRKEGLAGELPLSPGDFLSRVAEGLTNRIEELTLSMGAATDELEEAVMGEGDPPEPGALALMRLKGIRLHRFMGPQREAMERLAALETPVTSADERTHLRESANRTARSVEELDAVRDRLTTLQDHIEGLRAAQISRNGNILSIVAAIFLPLGFLTGLFGMNVAGLPGLEWHWAFLTVSLSMLALGLGLLVLFRWLKWF